MGSFLSITHGHGSNLVLQTHKHIAELTVLPLGSYNMLLGMDWLYLHRTKMDCCENSHWVLG